ncbi:MAG TPA: TauD/TfdA family dioxygenase [Usitatibacter sp.]|nr:TauD/TfdA family dioxygenase [Usitatibacter sp.]
MRIGGVDLSRPLDPATFARLEDALHEHGFIVMPRQHLAARDLVAFGRLWGPPEPHVIDTFHHPDDANVLVLSNVVRDGKPTGLADAGSYFHSDYSYLDVPARCTILYALQMPSTPAGTTFANQTRAYEDLPAAMKARIEPLVARHHYGNRDDTDETSRTAASYLNEEQKKKVTWVRHRLARPHPRTGRKALYAVSGSSFGIEGMEDVAALALLDELKRHATHPRYLQTHEYQVGDVIVWDNAQLLHKAPLPDPSQARTLWRVTIKETQ